MDKSSIGPCKYIWNLKLKASQDNRKAVAFSEKQNKTFLSTDKYKRHVNFSKTNFFSPRSYMVKQYFIYLSHVTLPYRKHNNKAKNDFSSRLC